MKCFKFRFQLITIRTGLLCHAYRYVDQRSQIICAPQILMQVQNQSETVGTELAGAQNAGVYFSGVRRGGYCECK
jgi:hypothetical protein